MSLGATTGQPEDAGAPETEVTPEMIEAGVEVYLGYCPDSGLGDATDRRMVAAVFRAMQEVRQ